MIDATLKARGFEFVRPAAVYRGPVMVHGTAATVEIDIPDVSFSRLPVVKLIDRSNLSVKDVAHLADDHNVCYHDGALVLDLYNPGGSILRVLADVATAIERSFAGGAIVEFERELAAYWQGKTVYFAIAAGNEPAIIKADIVSASMEAKSGLAVIPAGAWRRRKTSVRRPATVIHLTESLHHTAQFPLPDLGAALAYLQVQPNLPSGWRAAVAGAAAREEHLFISAPNAIIGWLPDFPSSFKLLRMKNGFRPNFLQQTIKNAPGKIGLNRMTGKEVDLAFCVNRNMAGGPTLIGKRVALIGCGTIGGYLGRMLVQSGAGCEAALVIYDNDRLSPGNLGRHLLGFDDLGKWKAEATAIQLRSFHPDVEVTSRRVDATTDWSALERSDLIIDATGESNVATALNELFMRSPRSGEDVALMHTYVFGNGVAGQTLLNLKDGYACYRCLKTAFDGNWRYNPLKDPSSELRQAPARCGEGGYVPFSVDAPVAAAGLALRASLDWAAGRPGMRHRTVIIDHEAGREKIPWVSPKALKDCPACGPR